MATRKHKCDWVSRAKTLRQVRQAGQLFLDRWTQQKISANAKGIERIAMDVRQAARAAIADPHNRDWSLLYNGSVLDD